MGPSLGGIFTGLGQGVTALTGPLTQIARDAGPALAQTFTAFYRDCPIVGDDAEAFRAALAGATQHVLATGLDLLGISAPEEMHREDAAAA